MQIMNTGSTRAAMAAMALSLAALAQSAGAQTLDFGLTGDVDDGAFGALLEIHGAPVFGTANGLSGSWGVAARADTEGNAWVGAGFVLDASLTDQFFVEASFMPGFYREGDRDLGHHVQFRSLFGVGWTLTPASAVILSIDHISNAGLSEQNPGAETVALRYRMSF